MTVRTSRSDKLAQPREPDRTLRTTTGPDRTAGGSPIPVSPGTGPVSSPQGRPGQPGYVGRVAPPVSKLPSVPQERAFRGRGPKPLQPPRRPPVYRYELTDLDDMFAASEARTDRELERSYDMELRRTGWRVMLGALIVVVILTVVAAFGVADMLRGATSLMP
ncbi:MAG TPA: hypothetical protein VKB69_07690 [Micromonosporaceae bacterium]|nr:hypothetical protein [Micromonosporaceae bacterium]